MKMIGRAVGCVVAVCLALCGGARVCGAQPCDPQWLPGGQAVGTNSVVNRLLLWYPEGEGGRDPIAVMAGMFTEAGGLPASRVVGWDLKRGEWVRFGSLPGHARALAQFPDGRLVVGGDMGSAGVHSWTGSAWARLGTSGPNGIVHSLLVLPDGSLLAGGQFANLKNLARWNGTSWQPFGGGTNGRVWDLALLPNGNVVMAGEFTWVGGSTIRDIAVWDGESWSAMGTGHPVGSPTAMAVAANGDIYTASGIVARWDGENWTTIGSTWGRPIYRLVPAPDGSVYAAGEFDTVGTTISFRVARWNGTSWTALAPGNVDFMRFVGHATAVLPLPDGRVMASGAFTLVGQGHANNVAIWDGIGWGALTSSVNGDVNSMAVGPDGTLYAAGKFTSAGGHAAAGVAVWNGAAWSPLGLGLRGQGNNIQNVASVLVDQSGRVVVTGPLHLPSAVGIAVWDGESWIPRGTGVLSRGGAAALDLDGSLIVEGGISNSPNGQVRLSRWSESGWAAMGMAGPSSLLVRRDGTLIGGFVNGLQVYRWDGTTWVQFAPTRNWSGESVNALAETSGGDLLVGGNFATIPGATGRYLARWDGQSWSGFGAGPPGQVEGVAVLANGDIVVCGSYVASPSWGIHRWDGTAWRGLGTGVRRVSQTAPPFRVAAVVAHPSGEIIVGGAFAHAGDHQSLNFARWTDNPRPWVAVHPEGKRVEEGEGLILSANAASGYSNVAYQWLRNGVPVSDGPGGASAGGGEVSGAAGLLPSPTTSLPATLIITNARPSDAGEYTVVFSNACGETQSRPAAVEVRCAADWNADGVVDAEDITVYLGSWFAARAAGVPPYGADYNRDGVVNTADITAFLSAWFAARAGGC